MTMNPQSMNSQPKLTVAICTYNRAASLAATWAQTRRWIACWPIWIGVDAIGVPLYLAQGLYPTAALYVVLAAICVDGWRRWQRMQA